MTVRQATADRPRVASGQPLLSIEGLELRLKRPADTVALVESFDLAIAAGEAVGLVGESGCGKSVTALALMRLLPKGKIWPAAGRIVFDGIDVLALPEAQMRRLRGDDIAMIFQEPMTSLHPLFSIGRQIGEALALHRNLHGRAAEAETVRLLDMVGIGGGKGRLKDLPGDLSGGQRQRVMIAMALACSPKLLIADEPTTALDVTIQAQIMRLIDELRRELGMALLLITHDLGVVAAHCDRVSVMYAGRVVERASAAELLARPQHRYTEGLIACVPELGHKATRLPTIAGTVPPVEARGAGCRFAPRCAHALDRCGSEAPPMRDRGAGHQAACWNPPA